MSGSRQGYALILVLWIMAAMVLLAAGLGITARTEVQLARNSAERMQARWAARAGINAAMLEAEAAAVESKGLYYVEEEPAELLSDDLELDLDGCGFGVEIEDECGKVNINTASVDLLEVLFSSRDAAEAIAEWRGDGDGAGADYYGTLDPAYAARRAAFETVDELLLVRGIDEEMLNAPLSESGRPLRDLLTVYSTDNSLAMDGQARLDLSRATRQQLQQRLGDVLEAGEIDAILQRQRSGGFQTAADVVSVPGLTREKAALIYDRLTVGTQDSTVEGLINVNTVPAEVLALLPGMDESSAGAVVAKRVEAGGFADVGGLLWVDELSDEAFKSVAGMLTVRSRCFRLLSTGSAPDGRARYLVECVFQIGDDGRSSIRYIRE